MHKILLLSAMLWASQLALAPQSAFAQQNKKGEELFVPFDVEKHAYSNDKKGCGRKAAMFVAALQTYKEGLAVSEFTDMKIIQPILESHYKNIREKGIEKAVIDNMQEYNQCVAAAPPNKDHKREMDMALQHNGCTKLNKALLETLDSIKKRKDVNRLMDKYQRESPTYDWTSFEGVPDPMLYMIAKLYTAAEEGSYEDAVMLAATFGVVCYY